MSWVGDVSYRAEQCDNCASRRFCAINRAQLRGTCFAFTFALPAHGRRIESILRGSSLRHASEGQHSPKTICHPTTTRPHDTTQGVRCCAFNKHNKCHIPIWCVHGAGGLLLLPGGWICCVARWLASFVGEGGGRDQACSMRCERVARGEV